MLSGIYRKDEVEVQLIDCRLVEDEKERIGKDIMMIQKNRTEGRTEGYICWKIGKNLWCEESCMRYTLPTGSSNGTGFGPSHQPAVTTYACGHSKCIYPSLCDKRPRPGETLTEKPRHMSDIASLHPCEYPMEQLILGREQMAGGV